MATSVHKRVAVVARGLSALRRLSPVLETLDQNTADALGIARSDLRCLEVLQERGALAAGALAEAVGLSPTALSTALQRLEAKAYIRRSHPVANRRQVLVEITEDGRTIAITSFGMLVRSAASLLTSYSIADFELVTRFLDDLHAPLRARLRAAQETHAAE
jgi:DNA-binding MarR family transcriptional regulator